MSRINITEQTDTEYGFGRRVVGWFDLESAEEFAERRHAFDGANLAGIHLRDQNRGQILYRTAGGRWVLQQWSRWQRETDVWRFVTDDEARDWLIINEEEDETLERLFGEKPEPERGPGRPVVGPQVKANLPPELTARIDEIAERDDVPRAEVIRRLLERGLESDG